MKLQASVSKGHCHQDKTAYRVVKSLHCPTADRGLISKIYRELKRKERKKKKKNPKKQRKIPNKPNQKNWVKN